MLKSPGSIAFHLGNISVHWYGLIMALSFVSGFLVTLYVAKNKNENTEHIWNLASSLILFGILGARLYYVLFNWSYYSQNLPEIFMLWHGGLSIHGGILAGMLCLYLYIKKHNLSFLKYADLFSYGLILGQSIGRWGNFFNSEAFGLPTNNFLKVYIPTENRPIEFANFEYFHPTFLYESIWNFLVFIILFFILRKKFAKINGFSAFAYMTLYSLGRFFIEGIRIDNIYTILNLHIAQLASLIMFFAGLMSLYFVRSRFAKK